MKNRIKSVIKTLSIGVAGFIVGVGMMASHTHKNNTKINNIDSERIATVVAQNINHDNDIKSQKQETKKIKKEIKKALKKIKKESKKKIKQKQPNQEIVKAKIIKNEKGFLDPDASIEEMNTDVIQLKRILTKSSEKDCIFLDEGEIYYEFTDGSWALANPKNNKYSFQPVELGDWDYELKSQKDLRNVVFTYIENKTQLAHDNNYKVEI
ncbi:hypothetical protein C0L75_03100 [Clostridium perfringens]